MLFLGGVRPEAVKVRFAPHRFAADLISLTPMRQIRDVRVAQFLGDGALKLDGGGGPTFPVLEPTDVIDLLVVGGRETFQDIDPRRNPAIISLPRGRSLLLAMDWETHLDEREGLVVFWSSDERLRARPPRLAFGDDAELFKNYFFHPDVPLLAKLLNHRRVVPRMTALDIRYRQRLEDQRTRRLETMPSQMPSGMSSEQPRATSLQVRGFRGFRKDAELKLALPNGEPGSGLTLVVGANNTGKSTLWESFDAISRKSEVSFSIGKRNRGTPGGVWIRLERNDGSHVTLQSRGKDTSETVRDTHPDTWSEQSLEIVSVPSRRQFDASFSRSSTMGRDWMAHASEFARSRPSQHVSQFSGRLFELHNNAAKKARFDKMMEDVVGYPIDWTIDLGEGSGGGSYYLRVATGDGVDHTSEGLGDGIISLIFILDALYDSEESTLLVLDEPELSLHPQVVRRLGRLLASYAADRQIVVFTHSPVLVSWDDIEAGAEIARVYKEGADSKVAQVPRAAVAGISKLRGGWRNPHTLGTDATEALFLDDGIIVVEGQEDAALLPRVADLCDVKLPGEVFGWGSGGESNVLHVIGLLEGLGFKKIAAVLDNNVPDTLDRIRATFPRVSVETIPAADIRDKNDYIKKVVGLLDERGKKIKPELRESTREVLQRVADYLDTAVDSDLSLDSLE